MMFFDGRAAMRAFAKKVGKTVKDFGPDAPVGRRWAVKVF